MTRGTTRILLGALLGVAGLWLSLRDIPAATLREALLSARWGWVAAALAVSLIAVLAVVLRWRVLLQPATVSSSVLGRATLVGQMLNIVLPFRLGEVARVYTAMGHSSIGVARLTASLAIEKALDLAIFGVTAAVLVASALLPRSSLAEGRWLLLPATTAVALAAMWLVVRWRLLPRIASVGRRSWRSRRQMDSPRDDRCLQRPRRVAIRRSCRVGARLDRSDFRARRRRQPADAASIRSAPAGFRWFCDSGGASGGERPPSLPGRLGIYNYLTVLTLGLYGVGRTEAATYSIALYFVAYMPKVVLGALVAADPSWRPSMSWTPNA